MMNSFVSDDEKWLMFNAKFSSADEVYESIYKQAKSSIYVVDNYIGLRTLVHLKNSPDGVDIILFSDNVGNNKLHNIEFTDFCKEYPTVNLSMKKTGGIFHDRFIVLDYATADERVFLCGASSKDAGARITSIVEDYGVSKYAPVIAALLKIPLWFYHTKNVGKSYPHHPRHNTSSGGTTFHNLSKSRNTNVWHSIISGWCIGSCAVTA